MTEQEFNMKLSYYEDYFVAILFGETDNSDDSGGSPLDHNYSLTDFDRDSMIKQFNQLDEFFDLAGMLLDTSDYTHEQACHDFYFTRVGHGVGFWECDHCDKETGNKLTEIAKSMGHIDIYIGDNNKIYID